MSLKGQVALVTGAGKGIGKSIALKLAAEGVNLALVSRTDSDLQAVADHIQSTFGVKVATAAVDVASRVAVDDAVKKFEEEFGAIDILINNAGTAQFGSVADMDPDTWEQIVKVNLFGTYYVTHAALPGMIKKNAGAIINVSSTVGQRGNATTSAYSAAKFGVMGFTESLMQEARKHNIRVTALTPSTVNTELAVNVGLKIGEENRMMQPEDLADLVVSILNLPPRVFVNVAGIWTTNPQ